MANFASSYVKISKSNFKKVGKNNTPLLELELMEPIRKKEDGDWKTVGHNYFEAVIWGDKATKNVLDLEGGTVLDLSPEIKDGDNGQWIKYKARLEDESWEWQGKTYNKAQVNIFDFKIRD